MLAPLIIGAGIASTGLAGAGEKIKMYGSSVVTNWQQLDVGDEEGHIIAIFETKQLYFDQKNGEKFTRIAQNTSDINFKTGKGTMKSYGVLTGPDGDQRFNVSEGMLVGKGHWKGTATTVGGTGKYEGVKGTGTFEAYSMAKGITYVETEGELEFPE